MIVYAGGPIDYLDLNLDGHSWRHTLEKVDRPILVYCPVCVGSSGLADRMVLDINEWGLRSADVAVFRLDGPSIGTPLEVDFWLRNRPLVPAVLVHPRPHGLVVREWSRKLPVVDDLDEAMTWLETF